MAVDVFVKNKASASRSKVKSVLLWACFFLVFPVSGFSSERAGILEEFQALYGISKEEAIDRIAKEAEARRIHHALKDHLGSAWAGAWIDRDTGTLIVATTDDSYAQAIASLGAEPHSAQHSQSELAATLGAVRERRKASSQLGGAVRGSFIDYPTNSVVLEVSPGRREFVRAALELPETQAAQIRFETAGRPPMIAGLIRGANCYENDDSGQKCSIGFSVEDSLSQKGYMTAAHCSMDSLDPVSECDSSTAIGVFSGSDWPDSDSAWVDTNSSFTPVSEINGYDDGILNVPSENAGIVEAPLYATVCRYGRTTFGPHCGYIQEKDKDQFFCTRLDYWGGCAEGVTIEGVTKTNACLKSGDSGGPFISGDGHAQGTLIGGLDATTGTCENYSGTPESYFQPALDTVNEYSLAILTTHGSNAPTISGFTCPDPDNSGDSNYVCSISHFDAQGVTTQSWTTNTGDSSQSSTLFGSCSQGVTVSVTLTVSNQYGSAQKQASFSCPSDPLQ